MKQKLGVNNRQEINKEKQGHIQGLVNLRAKQEIRAYMRVHEKYDLRYPGEWNSVNSQHFVWDLQQ